MTFVIGLFAIITAALLGNYVGRRRGPIAGTAAVLGVLMLALGAFILLVMSHIG